MKDIILDRVVKGNFFDTNLYFHVCMAGGGSGIARTLSDMNGLSYAFHGISWAYGKQEFIELVGREPKDSFVSFTSATMLAMTAFNKASKGTFNSNRIPCGVGVTSSVASEGERTGRNHKVCIVIHTNICSLRYSLVLNQRRIREEENRIIENKIFECIVMLMYRINKKNAFIFDSNSVTLSIEESQYLELADAPEFINNPIHTNCDLSDKDSVIIIPGSFCPLHSGHIEIYNRVKYQDTYGINRLVLFELSTNHTEKSAIDYVDLNNRIKDLSQYDYMLLRTEGPSTFVAKKRLIQSKYPNLAVNFAMGFDVFTQLVDPKFGYSLDELEAEFKGTYFYVFGRGSEISNKEKLIELCNNRLAFIYYPMNNPQSSTELRKQ